MSKRVSIERGHDPVVQSVVCPDKLKVYVDDLCVYDSDLHMSVGRLQEAFNQIPT